MSMHLEQAPNTVVMVGAMKPDLHLQNQMETRGITVRWARTIEEAAALLKSALGRTIVITEPALKDGNWRDLLERIRRTSIPVLLKTSSSTAELWWDALECGIEDLLVAPFSTPALCEYLEKQFATQEAGNQKKGSEHE
jgi:DNA-binding NtrC family response regulator